jgi:hypothetical protein
MVGQGRRRGWLQKVGRASSAGAIPAPPAAPDDGRFARSARRFLKKTVVLTFPRADFPQRPSFCQIGARIRRNNRRFVKSADGNVKTTVFSPNRRADLAEKPSSPQKSSQNRVLNGGDPSPLSPSGDMSARSKARNCPRAPNLDIRHVVGSIAFAA